jgi:WD40 repeat protein
LENAGNVTSVTFSPDGLWLVTTHKKPEARLWSVETGLPTAVLKADALALFDAIFSPDGNTVATCGQDQTILIHALPTLRVTSRLRGHADEVRSLAFPPNGRLLASCSKDGEVMLWDPKQVENSDSIRGFRAERWMCHPVLSPDGKLIAGPTAVGESALGPVASPEKS